MKPEATLSNGHLFGFADLIHSESVVLDRTTTEASLIIRNYPGLIDTMLNFPYFWGELPPPDTPEGMFSEFASSHFLQVPYTAWSLFDIWKRGYYLESSILLRSILEILVQLRYFQTRPAELEAHLHPEKKGVRFITMFDAISPGYYRKYYGELLSTFAHGKGGQFYFRYDRTDPSAHRVRMGCKYEREQMSWVMNQLFPLLFGFINFFPVFFPANTLPLNAEMEGDRRDALQWLEDRMSIHRTDFPQSEPWYVLLDKIVRQ